MAKGSAQKCKLFDWFRSLQILEPREVGEVGSQYVTFGIFGTLNYPIYYLIWMYLSPQGYESLLLRLIATVLCLILALHKFWPESAKRFLSVYWYFTITFCLPFFFTFMLIKNNGSIMWVANDILIVFFLMLLVDWLSAITLLFIGSFLGMLAVYILDNQLSFGVGFDYTGFFITYFIAILIAAIFGRNRQAIEREKLQTMETLGATIAHELRTPLAAIHISATALKNYLPDLLDAYQLAKENDLSVKRIRSSQLNALSESLDHIETETKSANTFISMLLTKVEHFKTKLAEQSVCSVSDCVNKALERYPFHASQRDLVHWQNQEDFSFRGGELLIIHVLFNLIKNALHYIAAADEGDISIRLEVGQKYNKLYFRDTGTGISEVDLPRIFDRFYTKTTYGAGVGLAFCKMVMQSFDGDITVSSIEGEYTEFVLYFPKV